MVSLACLAARGVGAVLNAGSVINGCCESSARNAAAQSKAGAVCRTRATADRMESSDWLKLLAKTKT